MVQIHFVSVIMIPLLIGQQQTPFKNNEEFKITIDYQLKERAAANPSTIDFTETRGERAKKDQGGVLPFLVINLIVFKLSADEAKIRCVNNRGDIVISRKAKENVMFKISMGFTDDIKDGVSANQYIVSFNSPDKKEVSCIQLFIDKDGTFFINGEKRGKF